MGKSNDEMKSPAQVDFTPCIDVTFQLLIFFLCNINFKVLEGKIPAFLPKDVGVNSVAAAAPLERIAIDVDRTVLVDTHDKSWVWDESQIDIRVQGRRMAGLRQFHDAIRAAVEKDPAAKGTLYPDGGALYIDCIKVLNECLRARFTDLSFGGTRMDS